MVVYIEYIFLDNLAINAVILYATFLIVKKSVSVPGLIFSSSVGGLFSALYPFLNFYNYLVKALLGIFMVFISAKFKNFKEYIKALLFFYVTSFTLAGITLMLANYNVIELSEFSARIQLFPFCIAVSCFILLLLMKAAAKERKRMTKSDFIYDAKVFIGVNENTAVKAYYDSGNRIYTKNGKPVVVISKSLHKKISESKPFEEECERETLTVNTVAGVRVLETVPISFALNYGKGDRRVFNVTAGISDTPLGCDIILHNEMLGD